MSSVPINLCDVSVLEAFPTVLLAGLIDTAEEFMAALPNVFSHVTLRAGRNTCCAGPAKMCPSNPPVHRGSEGAPSW